VDAALGDGLQTTDRSIGNCAFTLYLLPKLTFAIKGPLCSPQTSKVPDRVTGAVRVMCAEVLLFRVQTTAHTSSGCFVTPCPHYSENGFNILPCLVLEFDQLHRGLIRQNL
jgi:hypothetical protein